MSEVKTTENPCGHSDIKCKLIVAYVSLSSYFVLHQIDIISRHIAVAFNIPIHNTGIYFDKIHTLRWFVWLIGTVSELGIYQALGADRRTDDVNYAKNVRRYINIVLFFFVLLIRVAIVFILFSSKNVSYRFFILICAEGFFFGPFSDAYNGLCAQYIMFISPIFNVSRIFILLIQFILDLFWYQRPMLLVKIMYLIPAIMTGFAFFLLYHLYFNLKNSTYQPKSKEELDNEQKNKPAKTQSGCKSQLCEECKPRFGNDGVGAIISPILMNYGLCVVKEFLFPGTLPYGLLKRDRCHLINMLIPFINIIGPLYLFLSGLFTDWFVCWSWHYDMFWFSFIPLPIIFVYSLMAIHTRNPSAIKIRNSRPRVMIMTFLIFLSYGFLNPLGMIGVAKYAFRRNPNGFTIQGTNLVIIMILRSLFNRLSVGYSDTRISLGYHLPKFRPNHRMSKSNLRWYFIRQTFRVAWKDFKNDFTLDIKKYI